MRCWSHTGGPIGSVNRRAVLRDGALLARELDVECDTAIGVGDGTYLSPVRLDDRSADSETHPEAPGLRAHEPLEYPSEIGPLRAGAAVAYRDLDATRRPVAGRDHDLALATVGQSDRLAGVHEQVQDDLLELDRIARDRRDDRIEGAEDRDLLAHEVVAEQAHDVVDQNVQIEARQRSVLLACQGA